MAFENAPVPSNAPVLLVVQITGEARFVVVSRVKPALGFPPAPVRIKFPPEITGV